VQEDSRGYAGRSPPAAVGIDANGDNARSFPFPLAVILRHAFIPLDNKRLAHLCGTLDENLRAIEAAFDVSITRRNESFSPEGGVSFA